MTATGQHPASAALETILAAGHDAPLLEERLTDLATELARLYKETADLRLACSDLVREKCELEADAMAMEKLDTLRVGVITDLKNRLAMASRDVEQLLQRASIRLQSENTDFRMITDLRDVLDPTIAQLSNGARLQRAAGV